MAMTEAECLKAIAEGESAYGLLDDADPGIAAAFDRVDKALVKLMKRVKRHFPDAEYYTASGGFNLMLGKSHSYKFEGQQQLVALCGEAQIGDGDF